MLIWFLKYIISLIYIKLELNYYLRINNSVLYFKIFIFIRNATATKTKKNNRN